MENNCPNCLKQRSNLLFTNKDYISGVSFDVCSCRNCGLIRTILSRLINLSLFYPKEYYGKKNLRFNFMIEWLISFFRSSRATSVERLCPTPGKVLDIGCGRGLMLDILKKKGWQVCGTEYSRRSSEYAREVLKLPVKITKDLRSCHFPNNYFDVVTLWHVLEHMSNPVDTLSEIKRILKPGGFLVIEVPNISSLQANLGQGSWFHLDTPRHLYHFSPETLSLLLSKVGLSLVGMSTFSLEFGPFGMIQTILNRISSEQNFLYTFLKNKSARGSSLTPKSLYSNFLINLVIIVPVVLGSLVMESIASLFNKGGIMRVTVQK